MPGLLPARPSGARGAIVASPGDDDLRLNLSDLDIPKDRDLEVEGLKPSLLSRLFDLFVPLR